MKRPVAFAAGALVSAVALALVAVVASPDLQRRGPAARLSTSTVSGPTVVAVGDISCAPGAEVGESTCRDAETAELASSYNPRVVIGLGDLQYESGALSAFRSEYGDTWGALKPITRPVPGNHEYGTARAAGYYTYFRRRQPGPPGYYAFDVGAWRAYALNSNCGFVDCARQTRWLDRDMARNSRRCSILAMHHPRYSSGEHGGSPAVWGFWRVALRHRADVALAGHDHTYERFARMDASGAPARTGMVSFVSGAGGRSLYDFVTARPGSQARHNSAAGVLALRLGTTRYAWEYRTVAGEVVDAGSRACV